MTTPPSSIVSAIEDGVAEVTRRVEIYENDGETPWLPDAFDPDTNRLTGGTITVDYNSDERRKADISLLNNDFAFRLNPNGGFYYDKIIKLYRGVKYRPGSIKPRIAVIETDFTGDTFISYQRIFEQAGYDLIDQTAATAITDVMGYDGVVSFKNLDPTNKAALLAAAFNEGLHVLTFGYGNGTSHIPHFSATSATTNAALGLRSMSTRDHPLRRRVTKSDVAYGGNEPAGTTRPTSLTTAGVVISVNPNETSTLNITMGTNRQGAKWFDFHLNANVLMPQDSFYPWLKAALDYAFTEYQDELTWEAQLGEFMIDGANDQIFPNQIKLTTRDYTKKLLKDKLKFTSSFPQGTSLKSFVRAIAASGGVTRFREAIGDEVFPSDVSYERDTERWKIIKEVCTAFDYEVFFDNEGYLAVRKFLDPTLSPISHTFQTGVQGNLVTFDRSLNDSRIYNIIRIYGDPINNDRMPYFGEAVNDDPSSPTSIQKLGNRPWSFSANYFSSDEECYALARSRLQIMALESYEINFSSIYYPWMEVGEVVRILDPHASGSDPTRFLMDSISLPLALGPMSGTGKRVTLVGSTG
jgi:hypothetical protein